MKPANYFFITIMFFLIHAVANTQPAWVLELDKDGIRVYTKNCSGSPVKSVKAECIVTASLSALTAALLDVDDSKDWIYATKKVSLLKQISPTEIIYYSEVSLPWPISNRDFIVDLTITQDTASKTVRVTSKNRPDYLPHSKDIVRVEQSFSQWLIRPLGDGRLAVQYELQVDPGGNIPSWLVNLFATTGPFYTFQHLREQVKKTEYRNTSLAFLRN